MSDAAQRILNVPDLLSHGNIRGREAMVQILEAGLRAADPYNATCELLRIEGQRLIVGKDVFTPPGQPGPVERIYDLEEIDRIYVVGAGKGIQRVAKGLEDVLGEHLTGGMVIEKHSCDVILDRIGVTFGAHPVPDQGCVLGCQRILALLHDLTPRDLVFTCVANGVSSLLTLPVDGVSLEDVRQTTHAMQIERGVPTFDLNPVRNHIDKLKGGRLSRYIQPAQAIHIVAHNPPPYDALMCDNVWLHTLPECSTFAYAVEMLHRWDAWEAVPQSVRDHLLRAEPSMETVKPPEFQATGAPIYGVMPRTAARGMLPETRAKAQELGFGAAIMTSWTQAEASQVALVHADMALTMEKYGTPFEPPFCMISGGELLVTVGKETGMGGRNQEYAVSAAQRIYGSENVIMGSVDTDGTDGPGKQFIEGYDDVPVLGGGLVDGYTLQAAERQGVDLWRALRRHDTSRALYQLGCGVVVSHNVSITDLTVTMVLGRGVNPNWNR